MPFAGIFRQPHSRDYRGSPGIEGSTTPLLRLKAASGVAADAGVVGFAQRAMEIGGAAGCGAWDAVAGLRMPSARAGSNAHTYTDSCRA
jgi:hypothetical protein